MNVISMIRSRKAEETVRRHIAEQRVRLCEEHLERLRKELLDANETMQEVDRCIRTLRQSFLHNSSPVDASLDSAPVDLNATVQLYESDPSEPGTSSTQSEHSN